MQTQNTEEIKVQQLKALEYYSKNGVITIMEEILNKTFAVQPQDIYFFLSSQFRQRISAPVPICIRILPELAPDIYNVAIVAAWKNTQTVLGSHKYANVYVENFDNVEPDITGVLQAISELMLNLKFASNSQYDLDNWMRQKYEALLRGHSNATEHMKPNGQTVEQKNPEISVKPSRKNTRSPKQATAIPNVVVFGALKEAVIFSSISVTWSLAIAQTRLLPVDYENHYPAYKVLKKIAHQCTLDICETEVKHLPTPMFKIFSGTENAALGRKCHFLKALLLIPSRQVSAAEVRKWFKMLDPKSMYATAPPNIRTKILITQAGNITFPFDKPEQVIEFFVRYLQTCGLESTFVLGLQIAPYAMYNEVRNIYEPMTGLSKSPNDLVKFYENLSELYPHIKLLVDPFRAEDAESWNTLDSLLSGQVALCSSTTASRVSLETAPEAPVGQTLLRRTSSPSVAYISKLARGEEKETEAAAEVTDAGLETAAAPSRPEMPATKRETKTTTRGKQLEKEEEEPATTSPPLPCTSPHKVSSAWMWSCAVTEDCLLVSEMSQAVTYMRKQGKIVIFDADGVDVDECWTVDLAVGLGCDFIQFSGFGCSDNVRKLNRWMSILEGETLECAAETAFTSTVNSLPSADA